MSDTSSSDDDDDNDAPTMEYDQEKIIQSALLSVDSSQPLGNWEQHTRGIGSRIMAQMGYITGTGLGKKADGRVQPVEATVLPAGKSLGSSLCKIFIISNLRKQKKIMFHLNFWKKFSLHRSLYASSGNGEWGQKSFFRRAQNAKTKIKIGASESDTVRKGAADREEWYFQFYQRYPEF